MPKIASTPEMVDSVNVLVLADRRVTIEDIYNCQYLYKIVHDDLAFLRSVIVGFPKC